MSVEELPVFVGCISLVERYVGTFYDKGGEDPFNELFFNNIKYTTEGMSYLVFPDAVFHAADSRYANKGLLLPSFWGGVRIETVGVYDPREAVLKLAAVKSIEKRPDYILTLDPEMKSKAKKAGFKTISPEDALKKIKTFEGKYGSSPRGLSNH